jgi:hypothetical protein
MLLLLNLALALLIKHCWPPKKFPIRLVINRWKTVPSFLFVYLVGFAASYPNAENKDRGNMGC